MQLRSAQIWTGATRALRGAAMVPSLIYVISDRGGGGQPCRGFWRNVARHLAAGFHRADATSSAE